MVVDLAEHFVVVNELSRAVESPCISETRCMNSSRRMPFFTENWLEGRVPLPEIDLNTDSVGDRDGIVGLG